MALGRCDGLRACFDTANTVCVGDGSLEALRRVADRIAMLHLKDCTRPRARSRRRDRRVAGDPLAPMVLELGQIGAGVDERAPVRECVARLGERRVTAPTLTSRLVELAGAGLTPAL